MKERCEVFTRTKLSRPKKQKVCLIHAHFGPQGVAMIPLKRCLKLPLITTFYGYDITQLPREDVGNNACQRFFKEGDLFLVEGNNMKKALVGIGCPIEKIRNIKVVILQSHFVFAQDNVILSGVEESNVMLRNFKVVAATFRLRSLRRLKPAAT